MLTFPIDRFIMAVVGDEGVRNRFFVSGAFSRFQKKRNSVSGPVCALTYGTGQSGGSQKRRK